MVVSISTYQPFNIQLLCASAPLRENKSEEFQKTLVILLKLL